MNRMKLIVSMMCLMLCMTVSAASPKSSAQGTDFEILFDGVPALLDSASNTMYVSLLPDTPDDFKPTVSLSGEPEGALQMALGSSGSWHELPHQFNVKQWPTAEKTMRILIDGKESAWKLVFTTLPLVNLEVSRSKLNALYEEDSDAKMDCRVRIIDPQGRANDSTVFEHFAGIKVRGQHSSKLSKKPYGLEIRNDTTGLGENVTLLNIRKDDDWVLDAMYIDLACMRNRVLADLWNTISDLPYDKDNDFQRNGSGGEYVEVFVRGSYLGLYCLNDKIDRKKLNLKKTLENEDGTKTTRGLMFRGRWSEDATLLKDYDDEARMDSTVWCSWVQEFPEDDSTLLRWDVMKELIDVAGTGKHTDKARLAKEFNEWFYMENCVDFYIFLNAFYLIENTNKNYFLSFRNIEKEHRALFTLWDMDASFGRDGSGVSMFKDTSRYGFNDKMYRRIGFFYRLRHDNILHFNNRIRSHWDRLKEDQLSVKNVSKRIDRYAELLKRSGAIAREQAKWPKAVAENFDEEIQSMKEWYAWNYAKMDSIISTFEPYAGQDDPSPSDVIMPKEKNYAGYTIRTSHIFVNGIPTVLDVKNKTMYVSVLPTEEAKTPITVTTDRSDLQLSFDGEQYGLTAEGKFRTCNDTSRHLYIRKGDIVVDYKLEFTSLPIVCVDTDWDKVIANMYDEDKVKTDGYLYIIDAQRQTNEESVFAHRIATRVRGASSKDYDKKSLGVEIRDEEMGEVEEDAMIFGIREDDDWVLDAMYIDNARMRNRVLTDVWNSFSDLPYDKDNEFQYNGTHGQFVEVIINGEYVGLYCLTDKIDRKKLNLKKMRQIDEERVEIRGLLYKGKKWTDATLSHTYNIHDVGTNKLTWQGFAQSYPDTDNSLATWDPLIDFVDLICDETVEGAVGRYGRLSKEYQDYFYVQNLVDYWILFNIGALYDNTLKNTFLSIRNLNKTKQMLFTPWDMDASLGRSAYGEDWSGDDIYYAFGRKVMYRNGFFLRLMLDNNFKFHTLLHDRWDELKNDQLSVKTVMKRFKDYATMLVNSGAWRREHAMWPEHVVENINDEIDFIERFYKKNYDIFENYVKDYPSAIDELVADSNQKIIGGGVYDLFGRRVADSVEDIMDSGRKGVYIVNVKTSGGVMSKKVMVK